MAGPQNMYQTGYPNPQQQAAIRQQFPGGGPMGMMGAGQQQGTYVCCMDGPDGHAYFAYCNMNVEAL
jgi:hypothetical protein